MGMLEIPGTLRAASIKMDANATGGGDSIGNKFSQKFSFVDSIPATDGVEGGSVYCYTIPMSAHTFYYAKMTLSGKDSFGTHRTAEIEVFNGELQSLFLTNMITADLEVVVYGDTVRVTPRFSQTWYFTNHVEGYTGTLGGGHRIWGSRGLSLGGTAPTASTNVIDYVNISTRSDAIDFGDMQTAKIKPGVGTDGSRGVAIGGTGATTEIDYWAFGSTGNAADFGDCHTQVSEGGSASGGGRVIQANGGSSPGDDLQKLQINTLGNSSEFGELTEASGNGMGASDGSRGIITHSDADVDFVNILTDGNATLWGDQHTNQIQAGAASDGSKAIMFGGEIGSAVDNIGYLQINSLGYAADWGGELSGARRYLGATSDGNRAIIHSGYPAVDTIEFISMSALGSSAADFGEGTITRYNNNAISGD